jgi:type I restriction enzyme R subunit
MFLKSPLRKYFLQHYVNEGVRELDSEKLPDLLELKYESIPDAVTQLGNVKDIRDMFIGFQEALYSKEA